VVQQPRWRQVGVRRPWGCGLRAGGVVRLGAANSTQSPAQKQARMALPSIYMLSIDSLCVCIYIVVRSWPSESRQILPNISLDVRI
jgi:hypothetical protein